MNGIVSARDWPLLIYQWQINTCNLWTTTYGVIWSPLLGMALWIRWNRLVDIVVVVGLNISLIILEMKIVSLGLFWVRNLGNRWNLEANRKWNQLADYRKHLDASGASYLDQMMSEWKVMEKGNDRVGLESRNCVRLGRCGRSAYKNKTEH